MSGYAAFFVLLATAKAELESLELPEVNSVDVTNQKALIRLQWSATEIIDYFSVEFKKSPPEGLGAITGAVFPNSASGSALLEVPRYAKPGVWLIDSIFLVRPSGANFHYVRNPASFDSNLPIPASLENLAITVMNSTRDDNAPVVEKFEVEISKLRRDSQGFLYAPCKMIVRDDLSGFDTAEIVFRPESPSQNGVTAHLNRADFIYGIGGVVSDGTRSDYTGRVYFGADDPTPSAKYFFSTALIKDRAGNADFISAEIPKQYSAQGIIVEAVAADGTPFEQNQFQIPSNLATIPQDAIPTKTAWGLAGGSSSSSSSGGNGGAVSVKKIKKSSKSSAKKSSGGSSKKSSASKSSGGSKSGGKKAKKK
jgi:hypothetical protein